MKVSEQAPAVAVWVLTLMLFLTTICAEAKSSADSLFPEDITGAFLQAPRLENSSEPAAITDSNAQLFELETRLQNINREIEKLQTDFSQIKSNRTIKSKLGLSSETRLNSTFTPGNGGSPVLYSSLRFNNQIAGRTNLYSELYLQFRPGTYGSETYYMSPLSITTNFDWKGQPYRLQLGRFWIANTPFTIQRPWRQDDTWHESRYTYDGVFISSRLFGLNWRGFGARSVDGNGTKYDRYTLFSSASSSIAGGEIGITFLRVFDDTKTAEITSTAYDSSTVGLWLKYKGKIFGKNFELDGEGNINRLDQDKNGGPFPSWEYALRVDGKFAPLEVNYYSISRDYPITNTAIQPLSADFIWQYEENPWNPYYLSNLSYLGLSTVPVQLGNWGSFTLGGGYARENTPTAGEAKKFRLGDMGLTVNLDKLVAFPKVQGTKFKIELLHYNTFLADDVNLTQNVGTVSIARPVLPNLSLELGYQQFSFKGHSYEEQYAQLHHVPFAIFNISISKSTLEWKYYPLFPAENQGQIEQRHKAEWKTPIGPYTSLRLVYELNRSGRVTNSQRLVVQYSSGF